ncbi:MAG: hypothetical protein ACRDHW_19705, partial [Ktedonobacteraceae bacterium]
DQEYQYDPIADLHMNEYMWQEFSKLALSAEYLHTEVGLSLKEAQKVAESRCNGVFRSLADIERIDKIAKITIRKINNFVQKYKMVELAGMPEKSNTVNNAANNSQKRKRKNNSINSDITMSALFTL